MMSSSRQKRGVYSTYQHSQFSDDSSDFIELQIQNLKAHQNIKGPYLDHGQSLLQDSDVLSQCEHTLQFPLYDDCNLPFLDKDTEMGRKISRCIVEADYDDDCATDEDTAYNAITLLEKELNQTINQYKMKT